LMCNEQSENVAVRIQSWLGAICGIGVGHPDLVLHLEMEVRVGGICIARCAGFAELITGAYFSPLDRGGLAQMAIGNTVGFTAVLETDGDVFPDIVTITNLFNFRVLSGETGGADIRLDVDAGVEFGAAIAGAAKLVLLRASGPSHGSEWIFRRGRGGGPVGRII